MIIFYSIKTVILVALSMMIIGWFSKPSKPIVRLLDLISAGAGRFFQRDYVGGIGVILISIVCVYSLKISHSIVSEGFEYLHSILIIIHIISFILIVFRSPNSLEPIVEKQEEKNQQDSVQSVRTSTVRDGVKAGSGVAMNGAALAGSLGAVDYTTRYSHSTDDPNMQYNSESGYLEEAALDDERYSKELDEERAQLARQEREEEDLIFDQLDELRRFDDEIRINREIDELDQFTNDNYDTYDSYNSFDDSFDSYSSFDDSHHY